MKSKATWALALAACFVCSAANAEPDPAPTTSASAGNDDAVSRPNLNVRAAPVFGSDAATGDGWNEIVVGLDNVGGTARKGTVELTSAVPWGREQRFVTRAPFNVTPGRTAVVRLPTHGFAYQSPTLSLVVKGEGGETYANLNVPMSGSSNPLLVDVSQPSRLSIVLRNSPLSLTYNPATASPYGPAYGSYGKTTLTVGAPAFDRTTGDPILPEHAAAYGAATVVLIHSDALARLDGPSLTALVDWVISGGTLAVVPTRPEDLHGPSLSALVGGPATTTPAPPFLFTLPTGSRHANPDDPLAPTIPPSTGGVPEEEGPFDLLDEPSPEARPVGFFLPARTVPTPSWPHIGPTPEVRAKLAGYAGGNLVPSVYGASAPYGTGEVHLLAFDPTVAPMLDDPWVQSRITDLVVHAWDRRAASAIPVGGGDRYLAQMDEVRRALDPNENFRPALGISAILLVLYSIVAGPLTFLRAAKRGKPLAPLKWAPIWSAGAFGAIVLVGLAGKGWRGRARHVSLVESGAGVSRGTVRRYRGFFASETRALNVPATDASGVLTLATTDSSGDAQSSLRIDRDGASLEDITSLPWQTIVVREDGMTNLRGGVSIVPAKDGSVDIANHTGRELDDVMAYVPGDGIRYFEKIAEGEKVHAADGKSLLRAHLRRTTSAGSITVHPLDTSTLVTAIGGKRGTEVGQGWQALESATGSAVDWWPDGVPVVLAELKGGEGAKRDAGLSVESDRQMLRVVGRGGVL